MTARQPSSPFLALVATVLAISPAGGCLTGRSPDDGGAGDGGGCIDPCIPGEGQCVQDYIRFCVTDPTGCPRWTAPQPCPPTKPFCSNGRCEAVCDDECNEQGRRRCVTGGYQICGQHDSDKCLEWGPVLSCTAEELCWPATGECLPNCNGQPCSCEPGETQPCADVGTCSGGVRRCIGGFFGPCEWEVGPTAEVCDGEDNDCNGDPDDRLIAEACELQAGVCENAVKYCGGVQGWLDCTSATYKTHASSQGKSYEETETACDGEDNDCNGETDEPAACCQPECAGKACGADDGCGYPCKEGSCPEGEQCVEGACECAPDCTDKACGDDNGCGGLCSGPCPIDNATCQNGECVCDYLQCGDVCCAAGQGCNPAGDACCEPDCSTQACGPDPVCGISCGACDPAQVCVEGQCAAWKVAEQAGKPLDDIWGKGSAPSLLWVVGEAGMLLHFDGTVWQTIAGSPAVNLGGVWASAADDVWIVGAGGAISHYDGTWEDQTSPTTSDLHAVWGSGGVVRYAVGAGGTLVQYETMTWSSVDPGTTKDLHDIWGSSANDVWVVGDGGAILHYDGGWSSVTSSTTGDLRAVWGNAQGDLCAVGLAGTVVYQPSGGAWATLTVPTSADLHGVWGSSATDLWITGADGTLLHFDGQDWQLLEATSTDTYSDVWVAAPAAGWTVSSGGDVLQLQAP